MPTATLFYWSWVTSFLVVLRTYFSCLRLYFVKMGALPNDQNPRRCPKIPFSEVVPWFWKPCLSETQCSESGVQWLFIRINYPTAPCHAWQDLIS